jgi:hypothetical protein
MLKPDFAQPVPSTTELIQFWKEADFSLSTRSYPFTLEYVQALRQRYDNGRVLFASFQGTAHRVFDWYVSRNDLQGLLFFHKFWHTPAPSQVLSELRVSARYENNPRFQVASSFTFAGELASRLYHGGAYHKSHGSGAEEMRLAERSAHELIQDRFSEVLVFVNHAAWTEFFFDTGWDDTWILLDKRERAIHILAATDTD